jgi:hypothetical protein
MEGPLPQARWPYRIIFMLDRKAMTVAISTILIRSEKTYR